MNTLAPEPPQYDEHGYNPAPGTEYPFSISDIARATARILGKGWMAESGPWGTTGTISASYVAEFVLYIDADDDLCIDFTRYTDDGWPDADSVSLPDEVEAFSGGVYLKGACSVDGLEALAERCAAAIRAITGTEQPGSQS